FPDSQTSQYPKLRGDVRNSFRADSHPHMCHKILISKGRPVKTDALVATGYEMLAAGLVCLTIGTVLGEWSGFTLTVPGAGALLYLIIMGSCVAFTAFVWAMRNAPASKVMTYAYVNPVIATFLGAIVLSERVDVWVIAGMAIIVAGVALTTTAPVRPARSRH
ncbi:MAG: EamA family transporter, partial [Actinomycetota bacterium]|nr:EamA family transporter [Actinomycetota bacterium]